MSKELVNEIRSGFGRLFDQQDYTYMVREILQILARNLDNTVPDYGLELYGLHNSPLLSERCITFSRYNSYTNGLVSHNAHVGRIHVLREPCATFPNGLKNIIFRNR